MVETKAPEGGRPVSEMQERIARALYGLSYEPRDWATESDDLRSLYCRRALAAMKAMREPTAVMKLAGIDGGPGIRNQDGDMEDALNEDDFVAVWTSALDAEISIAEGGKDGN